MSQLADAIKKLGSGLNRNIVGIDIGQSSIKFCELSPSGKSFKLQKFILAPLSEAAIIDDEIQKPDEIIATITKTLKENKINNRQVCFGLFGPRTVTKRLKVAPDVDDLEEYVFGEADQFLPFEVENSEIDFFIINGEEGEERDALLVAAELGPIESFMGLLTEAGLEPKIVDLEVLALSNLLEIAKRKNLEDYNKGTIILDFGSQSVKVVVYKNNGPVLTKEINLGGSLITEEIQRSMNLSYQEAEDLKTLGDDSGVIPEEVVEIFDRFLNQLIDDLKGALNFYIAAGSEERINHCLITGGGAHLPGLHEALEALLKIPVELFNPFEGLSVDKGKFPPEIQEDIAFQGCVAIGLAMRKL